MKRTTCPTTGLVIYRDELSAKIAISTIQLKNKHNSRRGFREEPSESFRCGDCKMFHLRRARRASRV
jgi:hypothetical protein